MSSPSPFSQPPAQPASGKKSNVAVIVAVILGVLAVSLLLCGGVLIALLLPAVSSARTAARDAMSRNNLKQIGLALHNYHNVYQSLPPAYSSDETGQPLLSWRVAVLPFLDQVGLYEQFHLDEPWDSAHNYSLLEQMPELFRSPNQPEGTQQSETNYLSIRSNDSMFPSSEEGVQFQNVTDGLSTTIALTESSSITVPWTKPDDISPGQLYQEVAAGPARGTNILLSDGSVQSIDPNVSQATIDAMVTRSGGDSAF